VHRQPGAPAEAPHGRRPEPGGVRATLRRVILPITGQLVIAYLTLTAIWTGLGLLLTGPLAGTWVQTTDRTVAHWLVDRRTPLGDELAHTGALLAETLIKVVATAVITVLLLVVLRSWREPFLVACALILEAAVFISVTVLVGRPRPDVSHLDDVSVGTSFPSGHVAAAAAYAAIGIVVIEHTRRRWIRIVTVAAVIAVPIIVALSRMYQGVHYLTDAVGGLLLGAACVLVVHRIARPGTDPARPADGPPSAAPRTPTEPCPTTDRPPPP
jgi:undecaprenyl-diphosphatase